MGANLIAIHHSQMANKWQYVVSYSNLLLAKAESQNLQLGNLEPKWLQTEMRSDDKL